MKPLPRSIATRLLLAVALVATAVTVLAVGFGFLLDVRAERRALRETFGRIESSYRPALERSVFTFDSEQIDLLLRGIVVIPEIAYAEITGVMPGGNGPRFAAGRMPTGEAVHAEIPLRFTSEERVRDLGVLRLYEDRAALSARLRDRLTVRIAAAILEVLFISVVLYLIVDRTVVRDLRRIAGFVERIELDGGPAPPATLRTHLERPVDEIDEIARVVDEMNARLSSSYHALSDTRDRLSRAVDERETLLQELYHRTKNNMQVIISMLRLRAARTPDNHDVATIADDVEQRVSAMALVHRQLYRSRNLSRLELGTYIGELVAFIRSGSHDLPVTLEVLDSCSGCAVPIDTAIPCGLVVSELLSNALKHAFPPTFDTEPRITIRVASPAPGRLELEVADNGSGAPAGFDFRRDGNLGIQTIYALAEQQLDGTVSWRGPPGLTCRIEFPSPTRPDRV